MALTSGDDDPEAQKLEASKSDVSSRIKSLLVTVDKIDVSDVTSERSMNHFDRGEFERLHWTGITLIRIRKVVEKRFTDCVF